LADGGSIFLDEVGELPLELQSKLLRVLQEGEFEPVGSSRTRKANVRVIAATNRKLSEEVKAGRFREDLYYRLNVFPIEVPPLRERGEDIPLLAASFVRRFAQRIGRPLEPLSPEDVRRLQAYSWPGNVRELENLMERAVITAEGGRLNLDRALPALSELSDAFHFLAHFIDRPLVPSDQLEANPRSIDAIRPKRSIAEWRLSRKTRTLGQACRAGQRFVIHLQFLKGEHPSRPVPWH
jgi:transcriptional regulator with GAF, ATPase, and Fis domain